MDQIEEIGLKEGNSFLIELVRNNEVWSVIIIILIIVSGYVIYRVSPSYFDKRNCEERIKDFEKGQMKRDQKIEALEKQVQELIGLKYQIKLLKKLLHDAGFKDLPIG